MNDKLLEDILIRLARLEAKVDLVNDKLQYQNYINIDQGDDYEEKLYGDARMIVIDKQRATSILLQNEMKVGHPRASRLLEILEKEGIVSAIDENGHRKVLIQNPDDIQKIIKNNDKRVERIDISKYPTTLITGQATVGDISSIANVFTSLIKEHSSKDLRLLLVGNELSELNQCADSQYLYAPIQSNGYNSKVFALFFDLQDEIKKRIKNKANQPKIVVVIDEYSDLIRSRRKRFEEFVRLISKLGSETGVNLVVSTASSDKNILTFSIKTDISAIVDIGKLSQ